MLGLSLGCARCHPHKFDPVTTSDYYALYGIFASTNYAFPGSEEKNRPREFVPLVPAAEASLLRQAHDEQRQQLEAAIKTLDVEKTACEAELKTRTASGATGAAAEELKARLAGLKTRRADKERQRTLLAVREPYPVAYGVREGSPQNARIPAPKGPNWEAQGNALGRDVGWVLSP